MSEEEKEVLNDTEDVEDLEKSIEAEKAEAEAEGLVMSNKLEDEVIDKEKQEELTQQAAKDYDASHITALEGLEPVRLRPGMYIGSTGPRGLHHLVWEIVDNSIDEALAGFCTEITVEILPENWIKVTDNGRGVPVGINKATGQNALDLVYTKLHAGGKFDGNTYKVSGGLHGVGASVVNALSDRLIVNVYKNGKEYMQEYWQGKKHHEVVEVGPCDPEKHGTVVLFHPDKLIFTETTTFDYEVLRVRLQQSAFLNRGLTLTVKDERNSNNIIENTYCYEGGIYEYVKYLDQNDKPISNIIYFGGKKQLREVIEGKEQNVEVDIEMAIQYCENYSEKIYSFVNNIRTPGGGTHEDGFKLALTRVIANYAKENNLLRKDEAIIGDDTREGITTIISCKHTAPEFEGQTKDKLGNTEVRKISSQILTEGFDRYLKEHPQEAKAICEKVVNAAHNRLAAQKTLEATRRKNPLESLGFASKLADCRCKDASKCEIYIVEGDSAGGSAKQGRNSEFQAILPLRGKILNVQKASDVHAMSNNEILSMIQAFGTGITTDKKQGFHIENARYHKIIIMTDADVDGAHIRILLLTFIYKYMRPLIEYGYVYAAQPPLYRITQGKRTEYAFSEEEQQKLLETFSKNSNKTIQRYKGLGEMDPNQLWETTMDPQYRTLKRITVDDAIEADRLFNELMGDDVEERRGFIEKNAVFVENLDI